MMNKIIQKIYIVILGLFIILPNLAFAYGTDVKTLKATSVTPTSATLNGSVSFEEGRADIWFEYGDSTRNLNQKTKVINISSGTDLEVSKTISFDSRFTYFRVCFLGTAYHGTSCGDTLVIDSQPKPVVVSNTNSGSVNESSVNNSSSNYVSTSNPKNNTVKSDTVKNTSESINSQSASVAGATNDVNFLPDTFLEWILVIALIFIIVMFGRYLYVKRQEEKEEEKRKQIEAQLRFQNA